MSKIDIRTQEYDEIDTITFADDDRVDYWACQVALCKSIVNTVDIQDCDGDNTSTVDVKNIDNLILALKKAKELWGDK